DPSRVARVAGAFAEAHAAQLRLTGLGGHDVEGAGLPRALHTGDDAAGDTGVRLVEPPVGRGAVGVAAEFDAPGLWVVGGGAVPRLVTLVRVGGGEDSDDGGVRSAGLGGLHADVVERDAIQRGDLVFEAFDVAEGAAVRDQQLDVELEPAGHGGEAGEARVGEGSVVAEVLAEPGEARVFDG